MGSREAHWAGLMRAANRGDAAAYRCLLDDLAPVLRGMAARSFARFGLGVADVEDVVQETLLAVHLKRHTWSEQLPLLPWVFAIAQNKLIDSLRRRGHRVHVPIDDLSEVLAVDEEATIANSVDADRVLARLEGRDRDIVRSISIEGASTRQVAERLGMSEGAVRVALHRALKALAQSFRGQPQ